MMTTARESLLLSYHLAQSARAASTDLFMFNRLLQMQANAELRGMVL